MELGTRKEGGTRPVQCSGEQEGRGRPPQHLCCAGSRAGDALCGGAPLPLGGGHQYYCQVRASGHPCWLMGAASQHC